MKTFSEYSTFRVEIVTLIVIILYILKMNMVLMPLLMITVVLLCALIQLYPVVYLFRVAKLSRDGGGSDKMEFVRDWEDVNYLLILEMVLLSSVFVSTLILFGKNKVLDVVLILLNMLLVVLSWYLVFSYRHWERRDDAAFEIKKEKGHMAVGVLRIIVLFVSYAYILMKYFNINKLKDMVK